MKPRNWRTYFGYRPSRSLHWVPYRLAGGGIEADYLDWLREHRGFASRAEAQDHVNRTQQPCGLISSHTFAGEPQFLAAKPAPVPPLKRIVAAIRVLPWPAIEAVQAAIDERIAA